MFVITGCALPFNLPTTSPIPVTVRALGWRKEMLREVVAPGAFARSLKRGDRVEARLQHDGARPLGTTNDRLRLWQDAAALHFALCVPHGRVGAELLELRDSGAFAGVSVAFRAGDDALEVSASGERMRRVYDAVPEEVSLIVGPARPAYPGTTLDLFESRYMRGPVGRRCSLLAAEMERDGGLGDSTRRSRLEEAERDLGRRRAIARSVAQRLTAYGRF